jgi:hypothetical protein
MTEDYLKTARQNGQRIDTTTTETELLVTHEGVKAAWDEIQRIKNLIAEEQAVAVKQVVEKYKDDLDNAMTNYALFLSLGR